MLGTILIFVALFVIFAIALLFSWVQAVENRERELKRVATKPKRCASCGRKTIYYRHWGARKIRCEIHLDDNAVCKWCNGDPSFNKWDSKFDTKGRIRDNYVRRDEDYGI